MMSKVRMFQAGFAVAILFAGLCSEVLKAADHDDAITSEQALQRLKDGNDHYATDKVEPKDTGHQRRADLVKGQHPFAVVVTCADSRVPPELIFNQGLGDIFVIRVAGNIADPFTLGSVEYAVEHLHAPLVVILGHDHCGAVGAAMGTEKPTGNLGALLHEVHVGDVASMPKETAEPAAVKNNVIHQTEQVTAQSDVLKETVKEKKVQIAPAIYHLDTGKVEWLTK
jgi:carbonic anhydrase